MEVLSGFSEDLGESILSTYSNRVTRELFLIAQVEIKPERATLGRICDGDLPGRLGVTVQK
jgi:hypothetical protein